MKIALKFFPQEAERFNQLIQYADMIEVTGFEGSTYDFCKDYDIPKVIHNLHNAYGVNFANPEKRVKNLSSINFSLSLADKINASYVIVHPEANESSHCSIETAIQLFNEVNDRRVIIENMPFIHKGVKNFGANFSEMKKLLTETSNRFCLDFSHASQAAFHLKKKDATFIKKLLELNPIHSHISDSHVEAGVDQHLHFGDGNVDLKKIIKLIPNIGVTLETPIDIERQLNDVRFLKENF